MMTAVAHPRKLYFDFSPAGDDSTKVDSSNADDTDIKLHFPIYDKTGDPLSDYYRPRSMDLQDPKNQKKSFDYDADSNRYNFSDRAGGSYVRDPTYLSLNEYLRYKGAMDDDAYWQRRLDALMLFNKQPELPQMYKEGLFDRIFGGDKISVKPQGNVDVTFGGSWQDIKNPTLVQRAQKYGIFDFDMQMNINLLATVGNKLKLNITNNTKATFDYQNKQKLDYSGGEDEMLKKIEAGNISFPLKSSLITGVQSLFGIKMQLQFGKLWVTGVISQQKSQRKSLTLQGGSQAQQFSIKGDNYEENKDFLLAQYFHDRYDLALSDFPVINSEVNISKVEVWITNRNGTVNGVRQVLAFQDLGEVKPYKTNLTDPFTKVRDGVPDNGSNKLYSELLINPAGRTQSGAINAVVNPQGLALVQGQDFEPTTARQLAATEYNFNPQLGYIMLHTQMNPDDVLGIAYRYTYKGKVYQVGEFAEDLPPDTSNSKAIFVKLLKGTANRPGLPVWKLMMKNVYALGGVGVTKDNFTLNVIYQDPEGAEKRYFPEGPKEGVEFISLLNLDRLNAQGEAHPDGVFDYSEGITINSQQGKVIFPVLEPFGQDLATALGPNADPTLLRRYIFQTLYDSTKTVAQQSQNLDRYLIKGTYKSSTSSEIFLGGFNIPPGSVTVTAGGTKLVENQDYSVEYGLGRLKILNQGILSSGVPINIQYEDNSTFGFQQQNFMAARFDYYLNKNLTFGGTIMRLNERPFTQIVNVGEDPIKNTVLGGDVNFQKEVPAITRTLDKLPIYSTTSPSLVSLSGEVAGIFPGHPKQINSLDPEGAVYIDNFEGATSSYDLRFPSIAWSLASTPFGAVNSLGTPLFPEAATNDQLSNGKNRARLAWYTIEPTLVDPGNGVPAYVAHDSNQHYIRIVQVQDVFPNITQQSLQNVLSTFDLGYYPYERGPYNYDATNIDDSGRLLNPAGRWGGIQRSIDNTDFEASNVEYIQFWMMDPFITNQQAKGSLYINLGSVSEDVLKDSRMSFENGIPTPFDQTKLDTTAFGYVPKFEQQITRAFDNDPNNRALQDVGYDELPSTSTNGYTGYTEQTFFKSFLTAMAGKLGAANPAYQAALSDPSNDDYHYYRGTDYDNANLGVLGRYKRFNSPENNSPIAPASASYSSAETTIPESEDINRDNTLNQSENYFQYRLDLSRSAMRVGSNFIINSQTSPVKLPNGNTENETWYQFKIPIKSYNGVVGGVADFRNIQFIRMFLTGWQDSTFLRFASLELGRSQWRTYDYSLETPGETLPQQYASSTDFTVTGVNIEENGQRTPIPYVIPPGVNRQLITGTAGNNPIAQNEQSLSLKVCALQDGDARAVFKDLNLDMRLYNYLRMFIHCESNVGEPQINNADVDAFVRLGSDFTSNYYEYRMPLTVTPPNVSSTATDQIWPGTNEMDLTLQDLVNAKKERDAKGLSTTLPYYTTDSKGNTIVVVGTPSIGSANVMLGVLNPKKTNQTPGDDGRPKCTEVWFDELRMAGMDDHSAYAASGKASVQLADLGNFNLSGSMHTQGYGSIDQKIGQRSQDDYAQYNVSSNLSLGKLMPKDWGVQLPLYVGYTQNASTPRYDPFDQDVLLTDAMGALKNTARADSLKRASQDFTSITSLNLTNVRINGKPVTGTRNFRTPWSIKNFDFSYSYNDQFKHNPFLALDNTNTQKLGVGYNYSLKLKPIEPFKHMVKSKSKWFLLVKDFNFTPLPSTFTARNDLNRMSEETQVRNVDDGGSGYQLPSTFYKVFSWNRAYTLKWDLTKSISLDYNATNISRVDEPYGRINTRMKIDSLLGVISTFGKNTSYVQNFTGAYNMPLEKLPLTDWMKVKLSYNAHYSWTGAVPVAEALGNTIGNTNTKNITGDLNFTQLYNKWRWMRALNTKPGKDGKAGADGKKSDAISTTKGGPGPKITDLRKIPGTGNSLGDVDDGGGGAGGTAPTLKGAGGTSGVPALPGSGGSGGGGTAGGGNSGGGSNSGGNSGGGGSGGGGSAGGSSGGGATGAGSSAGGSTGSGGTGGSTGSGGSGSGGGKGSGGTGSGGTGSTGTAGSGGGSGGGTGGSSGSGSGGGKGSGSGAGGTGLPGNNYTNVFQGVNTANLTEQQMDSLVNLQDSLDHARTKAERLAKKKARKAARKARRAKLPELNEAEEIGGHILTMLTRATINYTQTAGTVLPGYMDSTRFMGVNSYNMAPGLGFVYGYQPNAAWLANIANEGKLSRDSLFNAQFQQTYSQNLNATATLVPFNHIKIDLSLTKSFTKSYSVLYKDTGTGTFNALDPYQSGSFNISYISVKTMFENTGVNSSVYNQFLANTIVVSQRLGKSNPYTNGLPDPTNPAYAKGYTEFSSEVLIPAFIAAYTGNAASSEPLINNKFNSSVTDNPFKYYFPTPNWKLSYDGLAKLPYLEDIFKTLTITNNYTGTMSMNGFNSNLYYTDLYGLGFPSFIDSNSHNYVPFFQVPNVTIAQQFNPLVGINAAFKNNLTGKFEIRTAKTTSLSLIDYQVSINNSTEYVFGMGFRKKGVKLPFEIFGVQKLQNELIFKMDIGLRDDKTDNTFLANNVSVTSRGQKVLRVSPSLDYAVKKNLTLHFFFDRQQTIPYVSSSYPTTTTKAGLTLRFLFAP